MPFSPTDTLEAAFPWVVAWGVPVAYLVLCVVMSLVGKRLEPPAPDEVPATPDVPGMHPVLLGALRCHEESEFTDERNAYGIALAAVVRMLGRGAATFTAHGRNARATALSGEDEGPIVSRRRGNSATSREKMIHAYGAHLRLAVQGSDLGVYDLDAIEVVMPPGAAAASVEELCRHARGPEEQYRRLRGFLEGCVDDLCSAGLARRPGPLARLVFNPFVNFLVCIWCVFGPAAALADPDPMLAAVSVGLIVAVMVFRALFVDLGLRLTPESAQVLAHASANVRWAEEATRGGGAPARRLAGERAADLLAVLLAMGRHDLAADLADLLVRLGGADESDDLQAASFCARRPYGDAAGAERSLSPVDLLLERTDDLVDSMR